ncbi:MAG: glycosyltransferase [Planctomycetota bacterium]
MRILRILTRLNLGGPARQVLASDPRLIARGHEVRVLCGEPEPGEGDLQDELSAAGVPVQRIPDLGRRVHPWRDLRCRRTIRLVMADWRPDVVHTHASKAGLHGRLAAASLGIPAVHTFHGHVLDGHFGPWKRALVAGTERRLARQTAQLIAVSRATARELDAAGVAPESAFEVIYAGGQWAALEAVPRHGGRLRRELGLGPEALLIGVLARLAPIKRPARALEAFFLAAPHLPEAHLVFVGDGPERSRLEQELGRTHEEWSRRVHLAGHWGKMGDVLPDLDLLLSASHHEGLPMAFLEGAAAGVPAVATPVGGTDEFVRHGETGWLAWDPAGLAQGLIQLGRDGAQRGRLAEQARERLHRQHDAEAFVDRLEAVYARVTAGRSGR